MSYLRDCQSDLFISYSHVDNARLFEQPGWIEILHRDLETRLAQLLGEAPSVWRDAKLTGNEYFDDTIRERLLKTALLLTVVSPRYVKSESCLKEVEAFCSGAAQSGGLRFADRVRLLRVEKTLVALEQMPSALRPVLGYTFYALDKNKDRPREFPLPPTRGDESYQACLEEFEDLAYDIKSTLEALRSREAQPAGEPPKAARAVYVADTVSELRPLNTQLRRELRQRGHVVFPCEAAPDDGARYRQFVAAELGKASLSVHMLGSLYGITPEGDVRSTIDVQIAEAGRLAATGALRRVLWLPEAIVPAEDRQVRFLETLRRDTANEPNTELMQTSIENLKTYLLRKLAEPEKPAVTRQDAPAPPIVYLIHDQRDIDAVAALTDVLMGLGYEVKPSYFEGDEAELRAYHQDTLVECDAALIFYGAANELWVQRKLSDLRRAFGLGRTRPYRAKALVVGTPARADKERLRTQEAVVIRSGAGVSASTLAPFVAQWTTAA